MCVYICIEICMCVSLSFTPYMYMYSNGVANHTFYHPHYLPKKKEFQKPISYPSLPEEIFFPLSYFHPLLKYMCVYIFIYVCLCPYSFFYTTFKCSSSR